jgi:endo-1,4-beta-xylanase
MLLITARAFAQAPQPAGVPPNYGPYDWVDPDHTEPPGTHFKTFHSPTVQGDVCYLVYLPPNYDQQKDTRYPVMYELHGSGGTARQSAAGTADRVDRAIRAGRITPMIVVFVNGLRGNTMYCDSGDGKYPLESVIINDLVPHIDATYRTIASRERRAIDGFSMGGFGAAHLGFKFPQEFGVISIMAPALLGPDAKQSLPARAWSRLLPLAMNGDVEYFRANDPYTLAAKNAAALRDRTFIRIVCHVENENWLAPRCEELHQVLMRHEIPHQFCYLSNVKTHNRAQCLDTLGDSAFSFFSSRIIQP